MPKEPWADPFESVNIVTSLHSYVTLKPSKECTFTQ
jgi:hypothetical protein